MINMKKVLMIAFHYPPEGSSSGVLRTLKFSKYLPEFGWQPYILTLKEDIYESRDDILYKSIPKNVIVSRTNAIDTKKHLSFLGRYPRLFAIPDRYIGWLPFAVIRGLKLIHHNKIDVLYSTSPMATAHLVALVLSKVMHIPWIADFRDPWIEEISETKTGDLAKFFDKELERKVLQKSSIIIVTTEMLKKELLRRHPWIKSDKIVVIPNGYDEDDFLYLKDRKTDKNSKFEIFHAGVLNSTYRSPLPLLRAVSEIIVEDTEIAQHISVTFLGGGPYVSSQEFKDAIKTFRLNEYIHICPRLPYSESLYSLSRASILLLIQHGEDTRNLIPAKAFEYLRVNRPIIAITLEGATSELINSFQAGPVVHPSDIEGIKKAIKDIYYRYKEDRNFFSLNRNLLEQYNRKELTKNLSNLLNLVESNYCRENNHA